MFQDFFYVFNGIWYVMFFSIVSVFIGFLIGIWVCVYMEFYDNTLEKFLNLISFFIRSSPIILQLFLICFSLNRFIYIPKTLGALFVFSINSGFYFTESIKDILKQKLYQIETCNSLGFSKYQSIKYIFIPQLIKSCSGLINNEFCAITKETAILLNINISEIIYRSKYLSLQTFDWFMPSIYAFICYIIIISLSKYYTKIIVFVISKIYNYLILK